MLGARLGCTPRAARDLLAGLRVGTGVALAAFGRLDETWLFRVARDAPVVARVKEVSGVVAARELDGPYAVVRTCAADAVARERLLRALHATLGERPLTELFRPRPALARKLAREDRALLQALRERPWADLDTLAKLAGLPARSARERALRLVEERVVVPEAAPADGPLAVALVRAVPSSTAAARRALEAIEGVARVWLPLEGEATYADALVVGAPDLAAARDVPGIASVDLLPTRATWEDAAFIDGLVRSAA